MGEAVVTVALKTIRDLLVEEGKFLFGVRDQVEELRAELEALGSFLKDANARKHEHESILTWVRQATRLAYRAEDMVEEYAIKVASKQGGGFRKVAKRVGGIMGEGTAIHKVGNKIGKIKTEITNLTNRLESYGINRIIQAQPSLTTIENQRQLRTTYAHEEDEFFVGMKYDVSKIVTWVTEDNKIRCVISICGIGGLGKTTIARKVYNHRQVQRSFDCFAWVSVTQQSQIKLLLQSILIQINGDKGQNNIKDIKNMEEDRLVPEIFDVLKNKRCFVVLDDIWVINDWVRLRKAFPILEGRSKILLTTRTSEVAKVAHLLHEPTQLDEKDGWDLLTKIAFNLKEDQDNTLPKTIENVVTDMLRKCGGLPLAISALGGILRNKDPLTEWETVNKKFGTYMSGNDGIVSVLALSYDNLPPYLKPCFLYMGCFKEDEEIDVIHLYQLWMAEGLSPSSKLGQAETHMDAASDVLDELISRNLVQPVVRDVLTDKKSCRIHDLVRELCLTKGKEEQFLEVERKQFMKDFEAMVIRYDGLDLCRKVILVDSYSMLVRLGISSHETYVRALMINCHDIFYLYMPGFKFKGPRFNFRRLRSLVLDDCKFKDDKFPEEIRDMIHLRYLSLEHTLYKGKLPAFIGDLQYLQTLNIANNIDLQLPNIFHKMKRLRCLYLPHSRRQSMFVKRLEFHGLNELEVVEGLDSKYDDFTHLSELVNLRRFSASICSYENLSLILVQLSSLLKVQYIFIEFKIEDKSRSKLEKSFPDIKKLLCRHLYRLELHAPIGNFPRYEPQFWPNLVFLYLENTKFEEDPMPFLQEVPNLRLLTFEKNAISPAYVGKEMYCSSKAFPKLTSLSIAWLENIEIWRVDGGAFPNLSTLLISNCNSFEIVPDGLSPITSLTRIDIGDDMTEEFRNKYGRLQNTYH